jgi:GT2 family glycosyltransferase/glycosyltransferase involved in cell wall biosynthesis
LKFLLFLISPLIWLCSAVVLLVADLAWRIAGKPLKPADLLPNTKSASVVIPNWNGRDLLARYLPGVVEAMAGHPQNEVIVVDNGSEDGSAEFVRQQFPSVKLLALQKNLGFGGGSNAGFRAAQNDVVVLLNSDMRVMPDFLEPLLAGFTDPSVFSVSCQIFISDPEKRREETGLSEGWWERGMLRVSHRDDALISGLYPCFYGGGGSCAYDRDKFLELGGFDEILAPFYLEDTDIGYLAWKRGWKVLYQPASVVYHEHRGTIGKKFSEQYIQGVLKKNFFLFCWKNIHETPRLLDHLAHSYAAAVTSVFAGDQPGRPNMPGAWRAFLQLPDAVRSRWRARQLAVVNDTEAFARSHGAAFHDRFGQLTATPAAPKLLFVSPYPVLPPVHGGAVFMHQTLRELAQHCEVHAIVVLDHEGQRAANQELETICASVQLMVRNAWRAPDLGSLLPHAVREFRYPELRHAIDRTVCQQGIDVIQLEYTALGQYAEHYQRLACVLFEHDIYFQSVGRMLPFLQFPDNWNARYEYLRAIRYELRLLPMCDRVQVCTVENRRYLESFIPRMQGRIEHGQRAGIDISRYPVTRAPREPFTMLFLGSFRHEPNRIALNWFTREVLPRILAECPQARLIVAGSDPPAHESLPDSTGAIELLGFVDDIQLLFQRFALFVCPIQNGSGVRVKLLEAFASGIPVVSTRVGAEGLARVDGELCALADTPEEFARHVVDLFHDERQRQQLAVNARHEVEQHWDMPVITRKLIESYREVLAAKRGA